MEISINWISELVDINLTQIENLTNKLTLGGFEVETIIEIEIDSQNETILDISATANRSDSLSIYGITNEISALFNKPLKFSKYTKSNETWNQKIKQQSESYLTNDNCSTFITIVVENLNHFTVPKWLKKKLKSSRITPSNNLYDFQTYILLETGYPFEFYDFDKICSKLNNSNFSLAIKNLKNNQKFITNNNLEYTLEDSILTVTANNIPISIAGTVVEKDFTLSKSTKNLLIEGSIFSAATIRQQSRKLGLRTERSSRYEKSIKNTYLLNSLYRLISLLRIENPKLTCKIHTFSNLFEKPFKPIVLKYSTINEILGPVKKLNNSQFIEKSLINDYLKRLNFKFVYNESKAIWFVTIPHIRIEDISREIDLIEEIGRLHGFDNFSTSLPSLKSIGKKDSNYRIREKITNCLLNLGFTEFINYSLGKQENNIKIINPLFNEYSNLRFSLLPNLIEIVSENLNQKNRTIEGFEYGHIFESNEVKKFKEKEYVSGIFGGLRTKLSWNNDELILNWFEAKGKIEQLFQQLNFEVSWSKYDNFEKYSFLHPYRSATIYSKSTPTRCLGIFGQINPIVAKQFNLSLELYLFEFDIQIIQSEVQNNRLVFYKPYSIYPKIVKNLSFIVQDNIQFEKIKSLTYLNGTELLVEVNLLDEFRGSSIPKNCTSLCLELVFQSNQKTLETKIIEKIISNLKLILIEKLNVTIRN